MPKEEKGGEKKSLEVPSRYAGRWVAWSSDHTTIVASGTTVREVRDKAKKAGEEQPWLDKVPDKNIRFGGAAFRA